MKWHKNPSSRSRVFPGGQTDGWTDRRTDMTKLIVAFRNFANAPITGTKWTVFSCSSKYTIAKLFIIQNLNTF